MGHEPAEAFVNESKGSVVRRADIITFDRQKNTLQRVKGYDVARGIAIIGMVLVNFHSILFTDKKYPWWIDSTANLLYGRAASLFVVLAGIGIVLMSRRSLQSNNPIEIRIVRMQLLKRSLILLVMGLLFKKWWHADILHFYGIFLSTGACLLSWPVRRLCVLAFGLLAVTSILYSLTEGYPSLGEWIGVPNIYTEVVDEMLLNGQYPFLPWMAFLLTGMCLGKLEVHSRTDIFGRLLIWGLAISVGLELIAYYLPDYLYKYRDYDDTSPLFMLLLSESYPISPLFVLTATASAVAAMVFASWFAGQQRFQGIIQPLKCAGQLSLTIYISHIFIGKGLEKILRIAVERELYPAVGVACTLVFCLVIVLLSRYWCLHFKRGPLEWLLRYLSGSMQKAPSLFDKMSTKQ